MAVTLPAAKPTNLTSLLRALTAGRNAYKGLAGQARSAAAADTNATVGQYRALQQQDQAAAAARQAEINRAASAAAKYVQGLDLGGRLAQSYQQAAQDQAGFGAGLSGQLRDTVGAETGKVQAALSKLGLAPVTDTTEAAGNAVYGVGGLLPANALAAAAPAAVAAANQTPANLVSYGQQEGIGALNAGKQQAAALEPDIAAALGKMPALEQSYLSQFTTAADREAKTAFDEATSAVKLQQAGDKAAADTAYRQAQLDSKAADRTATQEYRQAQLDAITAYRNGELSLSDARNKIAAASAKVAEQRAATAAAQGAARIAIERTNATTSRINAQTSQQNAATSRYRATHPSSSATKPLIRSVPGGGIVRVNPNGTVDTLRKPTTKKPSGQKTATASQISDAAKAAYQGGTVNVRVPAIDPSTGQQALDVNNAPIFRIQTKSVGALKYGQAYKQLLSLGATDKQARQALDVWYAKGEKGRSWVTNEQQAALRKAGLPSKAKVAAGHGLLSHAQYVALKAANLLPAGEISSEGVYVIRPGF